MRPLLLSAILGSLSLASAGTAHATSPAQDCLRDLNAVPAYLLANDTGAELNELNGAWLDLSSR